MRASVVVPGTDGFKVQSQIQGCSRLLPPETDSRLEGSEESLDSAVLPWARGIDADVFDSEESQREREEPRPEGRPVVGTDAKRPAVFFDGIEDEPKDSDRGAVFAFGQSEAGATSVIDQPKDGGLDLLAGEERFVRGPNDVVRSLAARRRRTLN